MHGLVNQAIERFACETYDEGFWKDVCRRAGLGSCAFDAMQVYDGAITERVLDALFQTLGKGQDEVLEDIGTFLVSARASTAVRRLLRFSGTDFVDFLYSLDDLPARVRLAVPDLLLPQLELHEHAAHRFSLAVGATDGLRNRYGHVMLGLLRAMADDYGALVVLEHKGAKGNEEIIAITLLETAFAEGRNFELAAGAQ
ncbi:heme NO-binding domain-containing protein [Roseovarius amoyensis]|uniref:heme NO-binding domain-containing protein n=1 Tax=Roseovarius amoyensis TaxID=2211448 RepID=UPI000DBE90BE|nr:heme NO-binding domain-containing protein [Roseovarius amoyensis]